jgi:hypothetical protein
MPVLLIRPGNNIMSVWEATAPRDYSMAAEQPLTLLLATLQPQPPEQAKWRDRRDWAVAQLDAEDKDEQGDKKNLWQVRVCSPGLGSLRRLPFCCSCSCS